MAELEAPSNRWDYSNKILEIFGRENVDEATKQKLLELFVNVEGDVDAHLQEQMRDYEEEFQRQKEESEEAEEEARKAAEAEAAEQNEERVERRRKESRFRVFAVPAVDTLRAIRDTTAPLRHNKWRKPNAGLTINNIKIVGSIAEGGFGEVYLIENTDTKVQYAMKRQLTRSFEDDEYMREPPEDGKLGAPTPPLTPSSEASKESAKAMRERHLATKRFNETKCYLQYIRSGHPNICNLEAFFDLVPSEDSIGRPEGEAHGHIFEYCDWGTLKNIVQMYYETPRWGTTNRDRPEGMPKIFKHAAIPEAFIWHVYMQLMDGLSFLHGDHELNKKDEFHRHNQVVCIDIKLDNVFLKSSGVPKTYPTVMIGDFGEAYYVPYGQTRWWHMSTGILHAPEEPWLSAKYDVWCVGVLLHMLAHSGIEPKRPDVPGKDRYDYSAEPDWGIPDAHLSRTLCAELEKPRVRDVNKRWTAARILNHIRPIAEARIPLMYRRLQPWAKPELDDEFEEGYLEWVDQGGRPTESEKSEVDDDDDDDDDDDSFWDTSDEEDNDNGGKGGDKGPPLTPPRTPISKDHQANDGKKGSLKRQREEEDQGKENLPPVRPPKRPLIRYRKLRAYRV